MAALQLARAIILRLHTFLNCPATFLLVGSGVIQGIENHERFEDPNH